LPNENVAQDNDGERSVFSRPKAHILAMTARKASAIMSVSLEKERTDCLLATLSVVPASRSHR
jgi:hypothetical protein